MARKNKEQSSSRLKTTKERLEEKKKEESSGSGGSLTSFQKLRGYVDALVFAYLLAMFIRTFVFELFMIPTGSMTPTLIGDSAGEVVITDYDGDGVEDVVYLLNARSMGRRPQSLQIFLMNADNSYKDLIFLEDVDPELVRQLASQSRGRTDMIIVNKFAYWFSVPERGDIAVFKVPYRPERSNQWEVDKPVYIKRVVGLPGETVTFQAAGTQRFGAGDPNRYGERWGGTEIHLNPKPLLFDGESEQGGLGGLIHFPKPLAGIPRPSDPPNVERVPGAGVLMIGDNAASSSDGRYWGYVPQNHLRGKALFRYKPFGAAGFLNGRQKSSGTE